MSLTRASVRIVDWIASEELGRTVHHAYERSRDDQFEKLCGAPAFEVEREDGKLKCIECRRRLYRPSVRRQLADPNR